MNERVAVNNIPRKQNEIIIYGVSGMNEILPGLMDWSVAQE